MLLLGVVVLALADDLHPERVAVKPQRPIGVADDDPRVNQYGGAIATGHPHASSGVRLMTQLARQFADHPEVQYGLTAMCVGIGQGGSVIWENPHFAGGENRSLRQGGSK